MLWKNDNKKPLQTIKKRLTAVIFGTPGETRTHYIPLRRRTLYPGEVRGHIQKIFHYEGLQGSNGSIVRRRPLYPTEPRGYTGIRPMVQADRYRTILSGSGLSVNGGNDRSGPGGVSAARSEVRFPPASKNRARVGAGSPVPHCGSVGDDLGGPLHHRSRAVADVDDRVRP